MLHKKQRTGITLLFVVSLIVLFMLLATTFLVVSSQYLRSAKSYSEGEIFTVDPVNELDQAFYILLRDTTDVNCPIRGHSLLADIYGLMKGFRGTVSATSYSATEPNQHIVILDVQNVTPVIPGGQTFGATDNLLQGRVLTITSGRAKGLVGRIVVNALPNAGNPAQIGVVFDRASFDRESVEQTSGLLAALTDVEFLVNGPAFQGKGAGFNPGTPANLAAYNDHALNPNRKSESTLDYRTNYVGAGDLNETWDAPDYQNVWLAGQRSWIENAGMPNERYRSQDLPSFYRPRLLGNNNFRAFTGILPPDPDSPFGTFDVDNDGDLRKDSIWVDMNLPVMTDDSGRTYKRLFAVLVRDMDGRLNLNAHSNLFHLDNTGGMPSPPTTLDPSLVADSIAYQISPVPNSENLTNYSENGLVAAYPRGQGFGPAEVNLRTLFSSQQLGQLRNGAVVAGQNVFGRNGFDGGAPAPGLPGVGNNEEVERLHFYDIPDDMSPGFFGYSYGSFWDIHGRSVLLHDYNGQPRFGITSALNIERENTEYERRLDGRISTSNNSVDSKDLPFTFGDLEGVLRGYDADNHSFSTRLADLAPGTLGGNGNYPRLVRNLVTTHGFDVPTPPSDLKEYLVSTYGMPYAQPNLFAPQINVLLPHGIKFGSRMNVNFPFGNGRDDNGNGIVDEAWGAAFSEYLTNNPGNISNVDESYAGENYPDPYNGSVIPFDHDADGVTMNDPDANAIRTTYARYLYVIARIIFEKNGTTVNADRVPDANGDGNIDPLVPAQNNEDLAVWVAQWAINVVDFRDPDSIMTPFEFDINPFDGWSVDGNPKTDEGGQRRVVFGCERPELLLTESFAFHNRRVEDLDEDTDRDTDTNDPMDRDEDYDQRLKPFGGVFIELWNPNSPQTRPSGSLYRNVNGTFGIDLTKRSLYPGYDSGTANNIDEQPSPVWRIVFTTSDFDLDNPDDQNYPVNPANEIERVCYFTPLSNFANDITQLRYDLPFTPTPNNTFVPTDDVGNAINSVPFLGTAVVGTGRYEDQADPTRYFTPLGRRSDADPTVDLDLAQTRGLLLDAGARQLTIREFDSVNGVSDFTRNTEIIPIENLNVSAPTDGYASKTAGFNTTPAGFVDATFGNLNDVYYGDPADGHAIDEPFDEVEHPRDGTNHSYRYAHLQRLANPLLGWDPASNPYRTVDTLAIDLHVFNGEDTGSSNPPRPGTPGDHFGTRERGEIDAQSGNPRRLLWRKEPNSDLTQVGPAAAGDNHFFSFHLENPNSNAHEETLGESLLNNGYTTIINYSYDYVNNPLYQIGGNQTPKEFPSLSWNNRPFTSQYELMMVPQTSSSQLLRRFSIGNADNYVTAGDTNGRFGHLLNFFKTTSGTPGADLYQIFDYLHVPTKFSNSTGILQPDVYATNSTTFKPPYNVLPTFREPGRINLNTIMHESVFHGLKGGNFGLGGHHGDFDWFNFVASRRGHILDPATPGDVFDPTGQKSYFANSFRSGGDGNLVHLSETVRKGADVSLLRSDDITGGGAPTTSFTDNSALLSSPSIAIANQLHNPDRHPYLRYKNRIRLGNMATTRSNVFAIWITVGYFEYDETTNTIGAELGKESGNVERHRAFYMVDRSIPVGFEPGKNHNVDQAVMIRRYIE